MIEVLSDLILFLCL